MVVIVPPDIIEKNFNYRKQEEDKDREIKEWEEEFSKPAKNKKYMRVQPLH